MLPKGKGAHHRAVLVPACGGAVEGKGGQSHDPLSCGTTLAHGPHNVFSHSRTERDHLHFCADRLAAPPSFYSPPSPDKSLTPSLPLSSHTTLGTTDREKGERYFGLALTTLVVFLFTMLVFGDPGVVAPSSVAVGELSTFCSKCQSYRPQGAIHCNDCDVCIEGYDHHCPWSGKCIGSKNVAVFHFFLFFLFLLMVYDGVETIIVLYSDGRR